MPSPSPALKLPGPTYGDAAVESLAASPLPRAPDLLCYAQRVKFRDYYFGKRVALRSPLRPEEIKRRIREEARSGWWPFHTGTVGRVRFGRLRLRYASSPGEYNAKPVLTGPIERTFTGSLLHLVYRGPTWGRLFPLFWNGGLILILMFIFTDSDSQLPAREDLPFVWAVFGAMFAVPPIMHMYGTRKSDEELVLLLDFLRCAVKAEHSGSFS